MPVRKKSGRRILLALVPVVYKIIAKLLFSSCRVEISGLEIMEELERRRQPYIAAFWHYGIFYIRELGRDRPLTAMVSASEDGEYIARLLESSGFGDVKIIYADELTEEQLVEISPENRIAKEFNTNVDKLNKILFASPVYAVTGTKS